MFSTYLKLTRGLCFSPVLTLRSPADVVCMWWEIFLILQFLPSWQQQVLLRGPSFCVSSEIWRTLRGRFADPRTSFHVGILNVIMLAFLGIGINMSLPPYPPPFPTLHNCEISHVGVAEVQLLIFTFDGMYSPSATLVWSSKCIWVAMPTVIGECGICKSRKWWKYFRNESVPVLFIDMEHLSL